MSVYRKEERKSFILFCGLLLISWVWISGFSDVSDNAIAEDTLKERVFETRDSAPLERISPVFIGYHRLKAVLKSHGTPKDIPFLLPAVAEVFSDPLALPLMVRCLTDEADNLRSLAGPEKHVPEAKRLIQAFAKNASRVLSLTLEFKNPVIHSIPKSRGIPTLKTLMDRIIIQVSQAELLVKTAFSDISAQEKRRLLKRFPSSADEFFNTGDLSDKNAFWIIESAKKIRTKDLIEALYFLADVFSDDLLNSIRLAASNSVEVPLDHQKYPGLKGRFLMIRETPAGLLLVGGPGPNVYGTPASIIFDLGGNDLYLNNVASPIHEIHDGGVSDIQHSVGVVIDFDGNDRYITPGFAAVASGFFGLGILLDKSGDDFYSGGQLSVGAAFFGMGCLLDMTGKDTYVSTEGGQGAALFGAALLFDGEGDDLFQGAKYVQGFGGPMGYGKLLDLKGDDHYRAGWKHSSSYGTKGVYQGRSQGVGWGLRKHAAGGIGTLHDAAGDDIYEAGNFSQGTGYYLGMGVLRDDKGNDDYSGSRYSQGSAAHSAIGALLDFEGNDSYSGKVAANQGAAWDLSVACLVDCNGNDRYKTGDFSLGAAAQNGLGMFFDGEGSDRYESSKRSLGYSGDLSYGGGRNAGNMGIFLDVGGQTDCFTVENPKNDIFIVKGNFGIFLDK